MAGVNDRLLRARRLELGISERRLAKTIGATLPVVRGLEGGGGADLPLRLLAAIADALAVNLVTLLEPDSAKPAPKDDVAVLGAILFEQRRLVDVDVLADQSSWARERLEEAAAALAAALPVVGLRLHRLHRSLAIRRGTEAATAEQVAASHEAVTTGGRLSLPEARILAAIVEGTLRDRAVNGASAAATMARLVSQGVVNRDRVVCSGYQRPRLTPAAAFSLGFD